MGNMFFFSSIHSRAVALALLAWDVFVVDEK